MLFPLISFQISFYFFIFIKKNIYFHKKIFLFLFKKTFLFKKKSEIQSYKVQGYKESFWFRRRNLINKNATRFIIPNQFSFILLSKFKHFAHTFFNFFYFFLFFYNFFHFFYFLSIFFSKSIFCFK